MLQPPNCTLLGARQGLGCHLTAPSQPCSSWHGRVLGQFSLNEGSPAGGTVVITIRAHGSFEAAVGTGRACTWVAHTPHVSVGMLSVAKIEKSTKNGVTIQGIKRMPERARVGGPWVQCASQVQAVMGPPSSARCFLWDSICSFPPALQRLEGGEMFSSPPPPNWCPGLHSDWASWVT